jgi:lipoprotein-anchoring transpeptidase ErfK/SrfK
MMREGYVMKQILVAIGVVFAVVAGSTTLSQAQTRYTPPPPVVLLPDFAAQWTLHMERLQRLQRGEPYYHAETRWPQTREQLQRNRRAASRLGLQPYEEDVVRRELPALDRRSTRLESPGPARSPQGEIDPRFLPKTVNFDSGHPAGTILIDTEARYLYLIEDNGMARRYGVGVGKPGFEWAGAHEVTRKAEWPSWRPPKAMIKREAKKGRHLPAYMEGGPDNPLGARALYLGSTLYRVHGTNQPWTIGKAVSSGCIRMRNEDVIDLYERVNIGTNVIVS